MRLVTLDLFRFFAAFYVLIYHYAYRPELSNFSEAIKLLSQFGYLGVPLFFMISGFVITLSAQDRSPAQFATSRFLRLYPTLWICVIFTVFVTSGVLEKNYSLSQILANFTLLNEYMGFSDIDGVYWTLKQELKFYFIILILILFGVVERYRIWLSIWLVLTAAHTFFNQPTFMGWFISPGYSPYFIARIGFYLFYRDGQSKFTHVIIFSSLLLSIIKAYEQANSFIVNPGDLEKTIAALITSTFFLLMYALTSGKIKINNKNIYVSLGAMTYPLYLIHSVAGKSLIEKYSGDFGYTETAIIVTLIMLAFSWLIYQYFEKGLVTPAKVFIIKQLRAYNL